MDRHFSGRERAVNADLPRPSEGKLLFLGGLTGLAPSFRAGGSGQSLAEAAQALQTEEPDFVADAESIERELFVPEDRA